MRADLIAVAGDPMADLRRLAQPLLVMRHGVIVHKREQTPVG
jgi:imidazolonepropionase-like amidohydrolase